MAGLGCGQQAQLPLLAEHCCLCWRAAWHGAALALSLYHPARAPQVEHAKFVAEAEKRAAAGGAEAERLRAALAEAERAAAAAAGAQRGAEARAGAAEQEARERVADLEVRPPAAPRTSVLHPASARRRPRARRGPRLRGPPLQPCAPQPWHRGPVFVGSGLHAMPRGHHRGFTDRP